MTRRSSCCCSCFSCFSGRNTPSPSGLPDASAAAVDPNAPPTEMVATGHHLQTPPSSSTSGAQGKSIEPSFSSSSAHQEASCAVVVKQDEVVPSSPSGGASSIPLAAPPCAASSSSTVPETATSSASAISSASSRVSTVAMATDDIRHSQQSVASSSTQPGEAHSSFITNTNKDAAGLEGDNVDVDLDALIERISERLRLKEREKRPQTKGAQQYWPTTTKTFFKLKKLISEGINVVKSVIARDAIKTAVEGLGTVQLVTAGLLVVENILERLEEIKANKAECLRLLKEMFFLAKVVRQFKERRQLNKDEGMHNLIKEATELIIEGCAMCCYQIDSSKYSKYY